MALRVLIRGIHDSIHLCDNDFETEECFPGVAMLTSRAQDEWATVNMLTELSWPQDASDRPCCHVCKKVFPTIHSLNLHITEAHDTLFRARAKRKENVYCCLVRGCKKQFRAASERKQHLRDAHKFSTEFNFDSMHLKTIKSANSKQPAVNGDDTQESMSEGGDENGLVSPVDEVEEVDRLGPNDHTQTTNESDIAEVANQLSSMHFVPRAVMLRSDKT